MAEIGIASAMLAFLVHRALTHPDPIERLAMAALGRVAAGGLRFAVWNWRGAWRPAVNTTATFLRLSHERVPRLRRAVRVGWIVLAAEAAVFVPWVWYRAGSHPAAWAFLCVMLALGARFLTTAGAWARREAATLEALAWELED